MSERRTTPNVVGTGFVVLDVVINGLHSQSPRLWAGGTCGNVLAILGFLGWKASAIARLSDDPAGQTVLDDLSRWNVDVHLARLEPRCPTPILFQEIAKTKSGKPVHRFHWTCPSCGAYFPSFRPITIKAAPTIQPNLKKAAVFYFDRVSPGILDLVGYYEQQGSLIVFEPSGTNDPKQFREALRFAQVLKYSHQRVHSFSDLLARSAPLLQIETLGEDGLRYRCNLPGVSGSAWRRMGSFEVPSFKDSSGSGDWCTAGILSEIGAKGFEGFSSLSLDEIGHALRFGQALAAWNCAFEGARGGMYRVSKPDFRKAIAEILLGRTIGQASGVLDKDVYKDSLSLFCSKCDSSPSKSSRAHFRAVAVTA